MASWHVYEAKDETITIKMAYGRCEVVETVAKPATSLPVVEVGSGRLASGR